MDAEGLQCLKTAPQTSRCDLETGCGGSTVHACNIAKVPVVISTESDKAWVAALMPRLAGSPSVVLLEHCAIGDVLAWGVPAPNARMADFWRCMAAPWALAGRHRLDVVLIDSRFRVFSRTRYSVPDLCERIAQWSATEDTPDAPAPKGSSMKTAAAAHTPQIHPDFASALAACAPGAYEAEDLVNVVVEKTLAFDTAARAGRMLDSGCLRTLVGIGLARRPLGGGPLKVIDFGGAAGYHHAIARLAFGADVALRWNVVETPLMAQKAGAARAAAVADGLRFFDDLEAAERHLGHPGHPGDPSDPGGVDLLLTSGALQYCPDPLQTLHCLLAVRAQRLFITRTPLSDADAVIVSTQQSMLGDNGPGPLPARFVDKPVAYPVTYVPRAQVEALIQAQYAIRFAVQEEPPTLFAGDKAVNAYFGYFCELR